MKLIHKISYNFASLLVLTFFISGVIFYLNLRQVMLRNLDSSLIELKKEIQLNTEPFDNLKGKLREGEIIQIRPINEELFNNLLFSDTLILINGFKIAHRELKWHEEINYKTYEISILKQYSFIDKITFNVLILAGTLILTLSLIFIFIFQFVTKIGFNDFYETIEKIKSFNINNLENLSLKSSEIDEFDKLNKVLNITTEKLKQDFLDLKEYTQNASHEIQTPLAIIQSKAEQLIQDQNLSEEQLKSLSQIINSISRLSKINKALFEIIKIENGQFYSHPKNINIKTIIYNQLTNLDVFIDEKKISIQQIHKNELLLYIDKNLSEVLFFNLLKNAVRYNLKGGKILISINRNDITISNSGDKKSLDTNQIFKRFSKHPNSDSLGLGLAIVDKICKIYKLNISYMFKENMHHFTISK